MTEQTGLFKPKKKIHFGESSILQDSPNNVPYPINQNIFQQSPLPCQTSETAIKFKTNKGECQFELSQKIKNDLKKNLYSLIEDMLIGGFKCTDKKAFIIDDSVDLGCLQQFPRFDYFGMEISQKKKIQQDENKDQVVKLLIFEESHKINCNLISLMNMDQKMRGSPEVIFCVVYELGKKLQFLNLDSSEFQLADIYYTIPDTSAQLCPRNFHFSLAKFIVQNKATQKPYSSYSSKRIVSNVMYKLVQDMKNPSNKFPRQMQVGFSNEDPQISDLITACKAPYSQDAQNRLKDIICSKFCRNKIKEIDITKIYSLFQAS